MSNALERTLQINTAQFRHPALLLLQLQLLDTIRFIARLLLDHQQGIVARGQRTAASDFGHGWKDSPAGVGQGQQPGRLPH